MLIQLILALGCQPKTIPDSIELSVDWRFAPDDKNIGVPEKWFAIDFNDSDWEVLEAGTKWEEQGYPDLDGFGWYRKSAAIPKAS